MKGRQGEKNQGKTWRWVSMWEVGRSGEDPGMIHRSKGVWCSGVLGVRESMGKMWEGSQRGGMSAVKVQWMSGKESEGE